MRFSGANESPSFKTAQLNAAHLFAVTRRHSVCTTVSSALLNSLVYVCTSVPRIYEWVEPMLIWQQSSYPTIFPYYATFCSIYIYIYIYIYICADYRFSIETDVLHTVVLYIRAYIKGGSLDIQQRYYRILSSISMEINMAQCVLTIPWKLETWFYWKFISCL